MKKILKISLIIILLSIVYAYVLVIINLPDTLIVFEGENIKLNTLYGMNIKLKDETIVSDGKSLSFSLIVPKRNFYSEDVASEGIYYNEKSTEEELCYEIKCEVIGVKTLKLQPD